MIASLYGHSTMKRAARAY
ncbi:Protein of unknown function [Pyronema omphalodes CBS 100304]|uniref:Uncharacterized protein n=1 Tax=Pyronema omphalodes (strain CBS 100304) TaxID=1076935 RepID=U4L4J5_PYROM|nr:Protein of unknown function [Pyronema omphalodes CBS 100304]